MEAPRVDPDFALTETLRFERNLKTLTACTRPFRLTFYNANLIKCCTFPKRVNAEFKTLTKDHEAAKEKINKICSKMLQLYAARAEASSPIGDFTFTDCAKAATECLFIHLRLNPQDVDILNKMLVKEVELIKDNRISNNSFQNLQELVKVHVCQYVRFKKRMSSLNIENRFSFDTLVTLLDDEEAAPFLRRFLTYRSSAGDILEFRDEVNHLKSLPSQEVSHKAAEMMKTFVFSDETRVNIPCKRIPFYKQLKKDQIDAQIFDKDLLQLMDEVWLDASKMFAEL